MRVIRESGPNPLAGQRVPELSRDDVREVFKQTSRIVYRVTDEQVDVLTVFEGHRRFPSEVGGDE